MPSPSQALLKRNQSTSKADFRENYIRHGHLVMPWCLANNVTYYAQVHNPDWSSTSSASKYPNIDLSEWDAAAEMQFESTPNFNGQYYETVILPDERRILFSEATKHLAVVDPGSVVGERMEYIVDGKAVVEIGKWTELWDKCEGSNGS